MPNLVLTPAVPHNPRNFMVPSRISAWFRTICPDGSLDDPIELGSVSDVSMTPNETTIELKTARTGILTTSQRVITDVSGTLSIKLHEMVGTNLLLLFRPIFIEERRVGNEAVVYGQSSVRLDGTTPVQFALDAVEYDPVTGQVTRPDVTIIRVESLNIVDAINGRGTQYAAGVDYGFVQASGGTAFALTYVDTGTDEVPDVGDTLTGLASLAYDGGTGSLPQIGEQVAGAVGELTVLAYVGDEVSGTLYGTLDTAAFVNNEAITQGGFAALANGAEVAAATVAVVRVVRADASGGVLIVDTPANGGFPNVTDGVYSFTGAGGFQGDVSAITQQDASTGATIARIAAGSIADGQEVVVAYSYLRSGISYSMLDGVIIEGSLQLQVLSVNGPQSIYVFHRVNLNVEGEMTFNPEERSEPTLQATILPDGRGRRGDFILLDGFARFAISDCT